jgi:hypothetical protein
MAQSPETPSSSNGYEIVGEVRPNTAEDYAAEAIFDEGPYDDETFARMLQEGTEYFTEHPPTESSK